ncbi:MAG: hypothetical protein LBH72_00300 [Proteiniphilum sp.]|jgi:hypothetical protein|nr:hypothetical protein [Proteiniphilum sp.]
MPQKKKKKQPQQIRRDPRSKTALDHAFMVIRKILRAYGFDPAIFDVFSKHQRRMMCRLQAESLRFKAEEGHHVPKRLVNFVAESTHRFMRNNYFGDESIGLTYLELATYGMAFATTVMNARELGIFRPEQADIFAGLAACFKDNRVVSDLLPVSTHLRKTVMMISKVNFRIYGFGWKIETLPWNDYISSTVRISSEEPKTTRFTYNNKERIAFRVRAGRNISTPAYDATLDRWFIYHINEDPYVYLEIYIQSHALYRAKERIDIFPAHQKNHYIMEPLLYMQEVSHSTSGRPLLDCYTKDGDSLVRFGYYPFVVRGTRLIVLTFLPLVSPDVPEGNILRRELGLQKEDTSFLEMDKLSFFLTVDFEQIPMLKRALKRSGIWSLVEYAAKRPDMQFPINQQKTQFVKKFFERKAEYDARS